MTKAKLDATSQRWVAALANYNFTLNYRPGKLNTYADGLSRQPLESDTIKAVCNAAILGLPYITTITTDFDIPDSDSNTQGNSLL